MQINNQLNPSPLFEPNLMNGHSIFGNAKNIPSSLPSSANALTISTGIEFENESLIPSHDESNENQDPNTKLTASQNNTIFLEDYITNEPVDFNKLCLSNDQLDDPDSSSSLSRGSKKITKFSPKQDSPKRKISKTSPKTDERNKGKKHPWQPAEDAKVLELVNQYGQSWAIIASSLGNRTGKQVRDRYLNYLRPDINEEDFTHQEDQLLLSLYYQLGHRWSKIASFMPGRTECQVKNRYYTVIKKKLVSPESNEKKTVYNQAVPNETLYKYSKMSYEINEDDIFREEENTITRESSAGLAAGQMPWSDPTDVISYENPLFNQTAVQNYPVINFTENHFQPSSFIGGGQKTNLNGILFDEFGHHDEFAHKKALSKLESELHNREKLQRYEELLRRKQALEFFYRKTLQEMNNLEDKEFPGHKMI